MRVEYFRICLWFLQFLSLMFSYFQCIGLSSDWLNLFLGILFDRSCILFDNEIFIFFFLIFFFCLFAFSRTASVAHGGSQSRGLESDL